MMSKYAKFLSLSIDLSFSIFLLVKSVYIDINTSKDSFDRSTMV